jgi:hypothetical protein
MTASQVIELIKTLEFQEVEKLFVLIKEYETELRCRQNNLRYAPDEQFEIAAEKIFTENKDLFEKLAQAEKTICPPNDNH